MSISGVGSWAVGSSEVVCLAVGSPGFALAGLRLETLSWRKGELGEKRAIASIFSRDSLGVRLAALGGGRRALEHHSTQMSRDLTMSTGDQGGDRRDQGTAPATVLGPREGPGAKRSGYCS